MPDTINYPLWVGRLSATLHAVLDAIDHPDDQALTDSVPVEVARRYLAELAAEEAEGER